MRKVNADIIILNLKAMIEEMDAEIDRDFSQQIMGIRKAICEIEITPTVREKTIAKAETVVCNADNSCYYDQMLNHALDEGFRLHNTDMIPPNGCHPACLVARLYKYKEEDA